MPARWRATSDLPLGLRALTRPKGAREDIRKIQSGVFFTIPATFPRGRHKLSRAQVREAQLERLLAAMTELLADRGYRAFGAPEIVRRARVSLDAFYDCFENKEACVFAGYERFIGVLVARMSAIEFDGLQRRERVAALLDAYLDTLASDLVVARAYQVEMDALGAPARARRRASLHRIASFVRDVTREAERGHDEAQDIPWGAYVGFVYAARQLASDALDAREEPDLLALRDDLMGWLPVLLAPESQSR